MKQLPRDKVGCRGFPRGFFKDYFRLVEVYQTLYKMPKLETALMWRQQAPSDFEFTLKAWHLITHPATSPTYHFCLHGGTRYQHRYSEEELNRLKDKTEDKETYVLFNNLNMYHDALSFNRCWRRGMITSKQNGLGG